LANSATEIAGISVLFPDSDGLVFRGPEATPPAYLQSNPCRFRFIHFAAHATAARIGPLDSAVVFARSGQDFRLYARDVVKARLNHEGSDLHPFLRLASPRPIRVRLGT
jgi:hypothetical protein